jgi:signal transduction histidine kinase
MEPSREELERLLASHDELVGSIAHDLKGMLSGTEGGLYLISSGIKKDNRDRLDQGLAMLRRNLQRIKKTVASVLYYVKVRQLARQPVEVGKLIESVANELSEYAGQLQVALRCEPASGSIEADEFAVFSLLVNLVEYALHGCSLNKTGGTREVAFTTSLTDTETVFDVLADGFSMENDVREIAFGRYYAPRGVDRSHLSLFIAHKLAISHGGSLSATVLPSPATRFSVKLPAQRPAAGGPVPDGSAQTQLAKEWESGK